MNTPTLTAQSSIKDVIEARKSEVGVIWSYNTRCFNNDCYVVTFALWDDRRAISSFTREDVTDLIRYWMEQRHYCGGTLKVRLKWVRVIFRWALEADLIDVNPILAARLPKIAVNRPRRAIFTWHEFERLLEEIQKLSTLEADMWTAACTVAYYTGLRISDVASLRWEPDENGRGTWVDMEHEIIVAHPLKKRAKRERLEIPIEVELFEMLQRLQAQRSHDRPWVNPLFYFYQTNSPLARNRVVEKFARLCRLLNLVDHSFHSFRHGFVSRLVNAGVNPIVISSMTGQTLDQIQQYAHVSREARVGALSQARKALHAIRMEDLNVRPSGRAIL